MGAVTRDWFRSPNSKSPRKPGWRTKMITETSILQFSDNTIRMVVRDDEPWWSGKDVCAALGIRNHHHAIHGRPGRAGGGLDDDERGVVTLTTPSGDQEMLAVNESGLYALIMKSKKPEAKDFKRWITHEILPQIRKTGSYSVGGNMINISGVPSTGDPFMAMLEGIKVLYINQKAQEERIGRLEDKMDKAADAALALPRSTTEVRELNQREVIRTKVTVLATLTGLSHPDAWNYAYSEYNKIEHTNLTRRAESLKCQKLDVIERDGKLGVLEAIIDRRIDRAQKAA